MDHQNDIVSNQSEPTLPESLDLQAKIQSAMNSLYKNKSKPAAYDSSSLYQSSDFSNNSTFDYMKNQLRQMTQQQPSQQTNNQYGIMYDPQVQQQLLQPQSLLQQQPVRQPQQQQVRQPQQQQVRQQVSHVEWIEAKAPDGRSYWYSANSRDTHWYNPSLVTFGIQLVKAKQQVPPHILDHLKRYRWEQEQQKQSSIATAAQKNQQEEQKRQEQIKQQLLNEANQQASLVARQEMERKRVEQEKIQLEMQTRMALEAQRRREEENRVRKEKYLKAKAEAGPLVRILLRKFLDTLGYGTEWVSSEMISEAVRDVEPPQYDDEQAGDIEEASLLAKGYYERKSLHRERAKMKHEDEYSKALVESEKDALLSQYDKDENDRKEKEFVEFFKYRSFKSQGRTAWNGESTVESVKALEEKRKQREVSKANKVALAVAQRETKTKRTIRSRLVNVDGHMILKSNNYGLQEGIQTISGGAQVDLCKQVKNAKSAYLIFSSDTQALLKEQNSELPFQESQRHIAEKWKCISMEERSKFEQKAVDDKRRYLDEYEMARIEMDKVGVERSQHLEQLQEKEELAQQVKQETAALEYDARKGGGPSAPSKAPPRPQLGDIGDAAMIALGPRVGLSLEKINEWAKCTRIGRMLIGRMKIEFDENAMEKALRRNLNKGRYTQEKIRGKGKLLHKLKFNAESLMIMATEVTFKEQKETEKSIRKSQKGLSHTAAKLQRQHELEAARKSHVQAMKDDIMEANQKQWGFMYRNRDALGPFITDDVRDKLEYAAKLLKEHGKERYLVEDPCGYAQEDQKLIEQGKQVDAKLDLTKRRKRPTVGQPSNITFGDMRPYQLEGLRWLEHTFQNGVNSILADEMGLGKTLQTIAFLTHLKFEMDVSGPFLVIVPLSVLTAWANEFQRWSPDMKVVKLHSSSKEERDRLKKETLNDLEAFDVVITTFEMIISNNMKYMLSSKMWWRYVVIDEGHKIKNDNTDLSIAVRSINCMGRLLLTGTPLQNNLHELWALLNYLYPAIFTASETFDGCFDLSKQIVETDMLEKAHYLIRPFVLRRTKGEVEQKMPPKDEIEIKVPLSEMQKYWYKMLLLKDARLLERVEASVDDTKEASEDSSAGDWKKLQSLMMQLRKVCNHPYLLPNAELEGASKEDMIEASGKLKILDRILKTLKEKGHRTVIFSQFTATLNILQDFCLFRGYKVSRLDGGTNRVQRAIDIQQFNREDSPYFAYLMSTRAGGLGINLATADTVILYDSDWNPQVDMQAMDRVHRIGQTKPVHVYRLMAAGTVEERVVQRAKKKLYLDKMVNRGSTSQAEALESLSKGEMLKMLKFGASAVVGGVGDVELTDDQLAHIMDRSKLFNKEVSDVGETEQDTSLNAHDFDGTGDALEIRQLDGVNLQQPEASLKSPTGSKRPRDEDERRALDLKELLADNNAGLSMQEIAERWAAKTGLSTKRARVSRYVEIDGHTILKANNYTMEEGEKSIFADETASMSDLLRAGNTGRQIAGRDYDNEGHCLVCWDGGDLLLCDQCCASYHETCLPSELLPPKKKNSGLSTWGCPHHHCKVCGRKAHASGGMLFRCTECPTAYCEDHLPSMESDQVNLNDNGREERFEVLGQRKPPQAYFMQCSKQCRRFAKTRKEKSILSAILEAQVQRAKAEKELEDAAVLQDHKEQEITNVVVAEPATVSTKFEDAVMDAT